MRFRSLGCFIAAVPLAGVVACGGGDAEFGRGETSAAGLDAAREIADLKAQVRAIANANTFNTGELAAVRQELDPLIQRLAALYGRPTAQDELPVLKGAWRQIWSDDFRPNPRLVRLDLGNTYQVVTDEGYFYNLSNTKVLGITVIGALRGAYTLDGAALDIEFTRFGVAIGNLRRVGDLLDFAGRLERGEKRLFRIPGRGPVGVRGKLTNLFLDGELRIAQGGTPEQNYDRIYILERAGAEDVGTSADGLSADDDELP